MLKDTQLKVILIFGILGILLIGVIGTFYGLSLNKLAQVKGYTDIIYEQIHNIK